mgnify:CR=1 FL=1
MAIINGWGRGTWGEGAWGTALPFTLTAPSAGTSALGTVSVVAKAKVSPRSKWLCWSISSWISVNNFE